MSGERPTYRGSVAALGRAQKTTRGAPLYSRAVNRPLGRRLAALGHVLGATPDQVTAVSAVVTAGGIAAIALAPDPSGAGRWWGLAVAALLVLGYALDAADGQLARLRGGGSLAGEWLDHVVDAAKIATLHLAVAVGAWRAGVDGPWLLVPLAFSAVSSTWFFTIILNDHLRRLAGGTDGQATVAGTVRRPSLLRSAAALPADYGVLCMLFLALGWPGAFRPVYTLLALGFGAVALASMVVWRRQMMSLTKH